MRTQLKRSLIIALMLVFTTSIVPHIAFADNHQAQRDTEESTEDDPPPPDHYDPPPPPNDGDPDAPLDGGVSLLVASGIGYGVKKIAAAKRNRKK